MKVTRHILPMEYFSQASLQSAIIVLPLHAAPLTVLPEQDFGIESPERCRALYVMAPESQEVEERRLFMVGTGVYLPELSDATYLTTIYDGSIRNPMQQARHFFLSPSRGGHDGP